MTKILLYKIFSSYESILSFLLTLVFSLALGYLGAKLILGLGVKSKLWAVISTILLFFLLFFIIIFIDVLFINSLGYSIKFGAVGCAFSGIMSYRVVIKKLVQDGHIIKEKIKDSTNQENNINTIESSIIISSKAPIESNEIYGEEKPYNCPACDFENTTNDENCKDCGLRLK